MNFRMLPVVVYLKPETLQGFQAFCEDNDVSMSEVMRELVEEFLTEQTEAAEFGRGPIEPRVLKKDENG